MPATQHTNRPHTMTWRGLDGHITLGWAPEDDDTIIPAIQQALDAGYVFWIVKKRWKGDEEVVLVTTDDISEERQVMVKDGEAARMLTQFRGKIGIIQGDLPQDERGEDPVISRNAAEIAASHSEAHRPFVGG